MCLSRSLAFLKLQRQAHWRLLATFEPFSQCFPSNTAPDSCPVSARSTDSRAERVWSPTKLTMTASSEAPAEPRANPSYLGAREDMLTRLPEEYMPQSVLEVGCAEGATGAKLKERFPECRVTGIELDKVSANRALERLDEVKQGDASLLLEELAQEVTSGLRPAFDLVLCGDVLEHLTDPWAALRTIRKMCSDYTIISLPNVAHISTLNALFFRGSFPYRERGIQDKTHLRFFGRNNLKELFSQAHFEEVSRFAHHRVIERPHRLNRRLTPLLRHLPFIGPLTEYQFISLLK